MDKSAEEKIKEFFCEYPIEEVKKGTILFNSSDPIKYIIYLEDGYIKQSYNALNGNEIIVHMFKSISYFPVMLVLGGTENRYEFKALTDVKVRKAPSEKVIEFIKSNPDVSFDLCIRFSKGLNGMASKIESLMFLDAYKKLAGLFLYLANTYGKEENGVIKINMPLTHNDLSSWLGIQRETVTRQLLKLQKTNIINIEKQFYSIPSLELLKKELS